MSFKTNQYRFVALTVILSLAAAAVLAELALGVLDKKRRQSLPDYGDVMRPQGLGPGGYLKENLNLYVTDGLGGKVRWTTNSAGFRNDREFTEARPPGGLRILSLGDSFNAGYRVGQEEMFAYLQEQWINRQYGRAEVLVAEIEEPTTGLYYLDRFGSKFNPDIVLLGITLGNDIAQSYLNLDPRGMYILNLEQGQVHIAINTKKPKRGFQHGLESYRIPPSYLEPRSHLQKFLGQVRGWLQKRYLLRRLWQQEAPITSWGERDPPNLLDINNGFGTFTQPAPPVIDEAYRRLFRVLAGFQAFCEPRGILLAVQLFPQRYQVQPGDWDRAVGQYGLRSSHFDLMAPNRRLGDFCREHGIPCLDATTAMAAYCARTGKTLYLPLGDMHWNREGHRAFFQVSREALGAVVAKGFRMAGEKDAGVIPARGKAAVPKNAGQL